MNLAPLVLLNNIPSLKVSSRISTVAHDRPGGFRDQEGRPMHGHDCNCDRCVMEGNYWPGVEEIEGIEDSNPMRPEMQ